MEVHVGNVLVIDHMGRRLPEWDVGNVRGQLVLNLREETRAHGRIGRGSLVRNPGVHLRIVIIGSAGLRARGREERGDVVVRVEVVGVPAEQVERQPSLPDIADVRGPWLGLQFDRELSGRFER